MYKSRILGPYLGKAGDSKYFPSSGSTSDYSIALDPVMQEYLDQRIVRRYNDGMAQRTSSLVVPNTAGMESFDSTENPRPQFNSCVHLKTEFQSRPFAYMMENYRSPSNKYYAPYQRFGTYGGQVAKLASVGSFGDYVDASRRAWWSMKPRFEGEVSMLNFIFELKDFRDIAKALIKTRSPALLAKKMRSFKSQLRRIDKKFISKDVPISIMTKNAMTTGFSAAKVAAHARLVNEFAIKPLISDVGRILAQAGQIVSEAQSQFQDHGNELNTSHYSEENILLDSLTDGTKNGYYFSFGSHEKQRFTATHNYTYKYKMRSESDAFKRFWGLQMNAEVIWNAIPFSFLVDYFAKVGQSIHFMTGDPNVSLLSSQYCESILTSYTSGYTASGDSRANLTIDGLYPIVRGDLYTGHAGSSYQRRIVPPNKGSALPKLKLPNGAQGKNMAALALCFIK